MTSLEADKYQDYYYNIDFSDGLIDIFNKVFEIRGSASENTILRELALGISKKIKWIKLEQLRSIYYSIEHDKVRLVWDNLGKYDDDESVITADNNLSAFDCALKILDIFEDVEYTKDLDYSELLISYLKSTISEKGAIAEDLKEILIIDEKMKPKCSDTLYILMEIYGTSEQNKSLLKACVLIYTYIDTAIEKYKDKFVC